MANHELARQLKDVALLRGEFTLRSGRKSSYYFDKYRFETHPALLRAVARELAAMLPEGTQRLAGAELGGVPLATAVALETGLPFVIVRKAGKQYGTENRIEGALERGERVVLLVLDRQEGAADAFAEAGVPYRALFTSESLGIEEEP